MYGNVIPKHGLLLKKSRSLHMRASHFVIKPASVVNSWNGAFCYGSVVDGLVYTGLTTSNLFLYFEASIKVYESSALK